MGSENEGANTAYVTFKDSQGADTAVLLTVTSAFLNMMDVGLCGRIKIEEWKICCGYSMMYINLYAEFAHGHTLNLISSLTIM